MVARLGYVLYWFCSCIAAIVVVLAGVSPFLFSASPPPYSQFGGVIYLLIVAALVWLFGRAVRYVLAGT
jgi:hypothetical protein